MMAATSASLSCLAAKSATFNLGGNKNGGSNKSHPSSLRSAKHVTRRRSNSDKVGGAVVVKSAIAPEGPPTATTTTAQGPSVNLPTNVPEHPKQGDDVKEVMPEDMQLREGELGVVRRGVMRAEDAERLNWYLRAILTAKVYDVAIDSPLDYAPILSEKIGAKIHFKREDLQPVKSFKLRGAYNRMVRRGVCPSFR